MQYGAPAADAADPTHPVPDASSEAPGRETAERQAAVRRGEERVLRSGEAARDTRGPYTGLAPAAIAHRAFATLAENVRDYAIFLMNPDGVITFWGEGARLIKWWTKEQAEGAHLRLLYPDGGSQDGTAEEHLAEAAEEGEYTGEGERVRSDGSTFWGGITLTALRDDTGALLGFAKVTRDLTELRATQEAQTAARRFAEDASRAKSLFLATISHEIRTPLNAIMAYTDLLGMELAGPVTDQQRDQLKRIRTSSMHLLGIVEDVLDFARAEAGRTVVKRVAGQVGAAVEGAISLVQPQAEAREVAIADSVSAFAADVVYWGDEERVRQILVNLLSNAVKFTEPGGRITVSAGMTESPPADVRLDGPGPWAYIRVEDTGRGIPPDRLAAVFEPFVQADMSHTRQHGGTGLGLSIAQRLARLMSGDLTVWSEPEIGSAFLLWLPAALEEAATSTRGDGNGSRRPAGILQEVRDAMLAEVEHILHAFVVRLRSDAATPAAHTLGEAELEDHLASFLSDLAHTLSGLTLGAGEASETLRDSAAIQRTIADRHGRQRWRLGWSEDAVRREYEILEQEITAAIRRRVHREQGSEFVETMGALQEFLTRARDVSLESFRRAAEE